MKTAKIVAIVLLMIAFCNCKKPKTGEDPTPPPPTPPVTTTDFIKGADVSWLTQMEGSGMKFYNSSGVQQDCIQILKDLGMNAIRLRVWVDPSGGWNNTTYVVAKSVREKTLGIKI